MAVICCDGDPKIYDELIGFDLSITGGQPAMDDGLENAVSLSLLASDYWGNAISEPSEQTSASLDGFMTRTLTNKTRIDVEQYAKQSLQWMVDDGIAQSVTPSAVISGVNMLALTIVIQQPDKTSTIRYQINWATMSARVGA